MNSNTYVSRFLVLICAASICCVATQCNAEVFDLRAYLFGDPIPGELDFEDGTAPNRLGSGNTGGISLDFTLDGTGPTDSYFDLSVNGNPIYVDASGRYSGATGLGASFDGASDYLLTTASVNMPHFSWVNNSDSVNQTGIFANGIQLWARPSSLQQNVLQDIIVDTPEHGIYITPDNDWGYFYDDARRDTNVDVEFDEWSHVMTLAGFQDLKGGHDNGNGVILLNGVAIAAYEGEAELDATALMVGAWDIPGDDPDVGVINHYRGDVDDIRIFIWGDNRFPAPWGGGANGQNFGTLFLGTDNEWIANELDVMGITEMADANLDTEVDEDDVLFLATNWGTQHVVNGFQVGDWVSRQSGDINYDGIVDLEDAYILNDALIAAGGAGIDFANFPNGVSVPEPHAIVTVSALLAMLTTFRCRRRRSVVA